MQTAKRTNIPYQNHAPMHLPKTSLSGRLYSFRDSLSCRHHRLQRRQKISKIRNVSRCVVPRTASREQNNQYCLFVDFLRLLEASSSFLFPCHRDVRDASCVPWLFSHHHQPLTCLCAQTSINPLREALRTFTHTLSRTCLLSLHSNRHGPTQCVSANDYHRLRRLDQSITTPISRPRG